MNRFKNLITLALLCAVIAGCGASVSAANAIAAPPAAAAAFRDVSAGDYFYNAVSWGVEKGIVMGSGKNSFSPGNDCTKGQIITFLWRANGSPKQTGANPFGDVAKNSYYYDAAIWARGKGLISGKTFDANQPCTRAMTVTYLWKLAGSPVVKGDTFSDVPASADYAGAVLWAIDQGITAGTGSGTFSPGKTCTRGQIITFIYRSAGFDKAAKPNLQANKVVDVKFEEHTPNTDKTLEQQMYAKIYGVDAQGNAVWTYTTQKSVFAQYIAVSQIGIRDQRYYFNDDGTITALNLQTGDVIWTNPDFARCRCVASAAFDANGNLYLVTCEGIGLYVIGKNGETIKYLDLDDGYSMESGQIRIEGNQAIIPWRDDYTNIYIDLSDWSVSYPDRSDYEIKMDESVSSPDRTYSEIKTDWKKAYLEAIPEYPNCKEFSLIEVDGNNIPEVFCSSGYRQGNGFLLVYSNGSVEPLRVSYDGLSYIKGTGLCKDSDGNMGTYRDSIFSLVDGKVVHLHSGDVLDWDRYSDEKTPGRKVQYIWDDIEVSPEEYDRLLASAFNEQEATYAYEYDNMYDEQGIIDAIVKY